MATTDPNEFKEDLDAILADVAKIKHIQNYELIPNLNPNIGDGFVAQFFTGEIKNNDNGELTKVGIKKAPKRQFDFSDMFKNETQFYSTIFPSLDSLQKASGVPVLFDNLPPFFCAGLEPGKEFIALENLSPLGYVMVDKKEYLDKEHLEFIFKIYGKFHALSFVLRKQNLEKYTEIHTGLISVFEKVAVADIMAKPLKGSIGAAVDALDPNSAAYDLLKELPATSMETFVNFLKYTGNYRCSIHGDCWSNNMLFRYNESGKLDDIKLLDFQLVGDSTPIQDLSYFFYSGASKSEIDNIEHYLKIYHNSLSEFITLLGENPDELFPFHIFLKEWKENALSGIFMGIYLWQIKLSPKEELSEMLKDTNVSDEDMFKKFEAIMEKMYKSNAYRERTSALLIHAFDYGLIGKDSIVRKNESNTTEAVGTES